MLIFNPCYQKIVTKALFLVALFKRQIKESVWKVTVNY